MTTMHPIDNEIEGRVLVTCPDCGQLEWWTQEEVWDHGYCRTLRPYPVEECPACGGEGRYSIDGGRVFDLNDDGEFRAYMFRIESPNVIRFWGVYHPIEGQEKEATLLVKTDEDIFPHMTISEILDLGWLEAEVE